MCSTFLRYRIFGRKTGFTFPENAQPQMLDGGAKKHLRVPPHWQRQY